MELVFPTTDETTANLEPCEHGDPCEACFVERSMALVEKYFIEANGYSMPEHIRGIMKQSCISGFRATGQGREQ